MVVKSNFIIDNSFVISLYELFQSNTRLLFKDFFSDVVRHCRKQIHVLNGPVSL